MKSVLKVFDGWQAVPAGIIAIYCFLGIFGPVLAPFSPEKPDLRHRLCPPLAIDALATSQNPPISARNCSPANMFGTDHLGRDIFSRLLHGARTSLWVVGSSVVIGAVLSSVIGAVINGWSPKLRLIAYLIGSVTIVPFAIFVLSQPHTLYIFGVINSTEVAGHAVGWSAIVAFSSVATVSTFAVLAIAYQYDDTCRRSWLTNNDADGAAKSFCRQLHTQIIALAPWIGFAAIANAALIFLPSASSAVQTSAITWTFEPAYAFEHIGMFSPFLPMVLFPIGFVTFGAWWFVRHILGRFITTSKSSLGSAQSVADGAEEFSTEEESNHFESRTSGNDGNDTLAESGSSVKRRRWMMVVIAIVAVTAGVRFGVAEAIPIVRELTQDYAGNYESALTKSLQERIKTWDCANELSSKLMTLRPSAFEQPEIEASQRCLDLYYQHRNAPSHRLTIAYALQFVPQTLTLALIGSIVSAVLCSVASASTRPVRRVLEICVFLVGLIGLTMTFGITGWSSAVSLWFSAADLAISRALYIVRDFSVALGISYLTIAISKPSIRFATAVPKLDALSNWASFFVPCVLLTSGLLTLFHYRFPANFLFYDDNLGVIANPSMEQIYIGGGSPIRNWLWTYWFALIGYATIVFGVFAAAIWGFRLFVRSGTNSVDQTPVSPNNPSLDADPSESSQADPHSLPTPP